MLVYVVCYDVSDDHQRQRIAHILSRYGQRVQYSVFEIVLRSAAELESLCQQLRTGMDEETDIRLYRLCAHCRQQSRDVQGESIIDLPAVIIV